MIKILIRKASPKTTTLQNGDIILLDNKFYLLSPHPEEDSKYFLAGFGGDYWSSLQMTLAEIDHDIKKNDGEIFSKNDWDIQLEESK